MFEVGFSELVLIGIVALLVIGPERLPGIARTAGLWLGRMRSMVSSVKHDIDRELRTQELERILRDQVRLPTTEELLESPTKPKPVVPSSSLASASTVPTPDERPAPPGN